MTSKYMFDDTLPANIVRDSKLGIQPEDRIYGIVGDVIVQSAMKYPSWEFKAVRMIERKIDGAVHRHAVEFFLYDDKKKNIGKIGAGNWNYDNSVVEFTNDRIVKNLQRGRTIKTSKLKVALKHVDRWFTTPPLAETMENSTELIYTAAENTIRDFARRHNWDFDKICGSLHDYIMANIEQLTPHMVSAPNSTFELAQAVDNYTNLEIARGVYEAPNTKKLTVVIQDDKYLVQREGQPFYVKTSDTLPEPVRAAVGMLKLVENGQYLRDIGFRHSPTTFLVLYDGAIDAEF